MTPLAIIKYIVEHLEKTAYEPWVNVLLFALFASVVAKTISFLLGSNGRDAVARLVIWAKVLFTSRRGYAPEFENVRLRMEPYADFLGSLYLAFIGVYSAVAVGVAFIIAFAPGRTPWWLSGVVTCWVCASFFYMRTNLESASWAYHRIKHPGA